MGETDLISRRAAIDNFERYRELFGWDDGERERAILSRVIKELQSMPSAPPEIIRCKDCKYHTHMWYCEAWNNSPGFPAVSDDMFCSLAERREDD